MLTFRRELCGSQAGLTLIELLASIVILGIVSTMLIVGWINLQRASASAVRTNNARGTVRDAMSRISIELRGAQPTALPTQTPSPAAQPPVTLATPMEVRFHSAFNAPDANSDGSGVAALLATRIWLDTSAVPPAPWNPQGRTLYLQRDVDGNGSFSDAADRSIILARNVANGKLADPTNGTWPGTTYTPVFVYGYRAAEGDPVLWTDNADSSLTLASIVAIRARLIIDRKMGGAPHYIDLTTTVRLRNASSE